MRTRLATHARSILKAALAASDPVAAVLRHVRVENATLHAGASTYALDRFENIYVVGAGKAAAPMARAMERLLGKRISSGVVNVKYGHLSPLRRITTIECGHPVPDANGVQGADRIARLAASATANDLVVCLISGGASALAPAPAPPITLEDKQAITGLLLACGANIGEINCVRKHISALKGGQLARLCYPATVLTLALSDVIGDDPAVIGSGPTAPDRSTFADALTILGRYNLLDRAPATVRARLEAGAAGLIAETPKSGDPVFRRARNLVVGSNRLAVDAASSHARSLGFHMLVLSTFVEGETRDVARVHAAIMQEIAANGRPLKRPACVISGGETTVTIRGTGLGGRNMEFSLAAAIDIAGLQDVAVLSAGTDGTDGPTDAAGAIADGTTIARAEALGLDARQFLASNNSYRFFDALGDLVKTGPTNTNVMDVRILLLG